jgi:hypothetical protein
LLPLLWYTPEHFIAKGDYFPYLFSAENAEHDFYLWSTNNLGNPSCHPAYALYGLLWLFAQLVLPDIGAWQIALRILYFLGAASSMLYLTKTVYPKEKSAAMVACIFYVFNFSILGILLNIGVMWTYAFLPLLLALFTKIAQRENAYKHIVLFGVTFTIVGSISSINLADVALIAISISGVLLYYTVLERKISMKQLATNLAMLLVVTLLLSIWWIVPIFNCYLLSPSTQLGREINVFSWSWTHARASFLNLLWLNGGWAWKPEYFPYYSSYSENAALTVLMFIPFLLASTSLFFRDGKRKLNTYLMLLILCFIFLAKGLHEPFGFVNAFLYKHIPYMNMFREPISKFTLVMMPFLALLVGYAVDKLASGLAHSKFRHSAIFPKIFTACIILIFVISAFPIITNPIETKTEELPYSSYVQVPRYWYEAGQWLNSKTEDHRVLVTPMDDHYQVPYAWGYYGTDSFLERLIQKPIVSPCYTYSYMVNPTTTMLINQLRDAMKHNRTEEFESITQLLNVKYILQRNDLDYEYLTLNNRDIATPEKMRHFLSNQPNLTLVKTIGKLDIYEYAHAQPYVRALESAQPQQYSIEITNKTITSLEWKFDSIEELTEWQNTTPENQFGAVCRLHLQNSTLKFELWNSTWGWKTINSPLITARYEAKYTFRLDIKGENTEDVHIKILEYGNNKEMPHTEYKYYVADGTFDWKNTQLDYVPKNENTTFLQLSIWNGHNTSRPFPNKIWIDNVEIREYETKLNTMRIQQALEASQDNGPARITQSSRLSPTRILVEVDASRPFTLAISEAHDPRWRAYLKGITYDSVSVFSVMTGFLINETGQIQVVIEYEPQKWFYVGCGVSLAALILCIVFFVHVLTRNRDTL